MAGNRENAKLNHPMAPKVIKYVVLAVIAVNVAIIAYVLLGSSTPPEPSMPSPNGYYQFVRAAQMVSRPLSNEYAYGTMNKDRLERLLATNQAPLQVVHLGLGLESCVPPEYFPNRTIQRSVLLGNFRVLSHLICAEGRLKVLDGQTNDAVLSFLDAVRLGQKCSFGGELDAKFLGFYCEKEGLTNLQAVSGSFNVPECHEIISVLQMVETKEEPAETFWRRTVKSLHKTSTWRDEVDLIIHYRDFRELKEEFFDTVGDQVTRRRQAMINFAARAYELEKGKPPRNVTDLVPDYLKAVPKDPVTGKDLGLGR